MITAQNTYTKYLQSINQMFYNKRYVLTYNYTHIKYRIYYG